jgi:streptopain
MYETPNLTVKTKNTTGNGNLKSYEWETFEYYPTFNTALFESLQKWQREGTRYEHWQSGQHLTTEIYNMIMSMTMDYYPTEAFILTEYEATNEMIGPLVTTTWGQDSPHNLLTPNNYSTGCVATAMAQVMKYHQWPNEYNWSIMVDNYNSSSISQESKNEVAKLMRIAGTSVSTSYGKDGSGAQTSDVPFALKTYFKYSSNVKYSNYDYSGAIREIQARRPVIMNGKRNLVLGIFPSDGHAWVCDGYSSISSKKKTTVVVINGMMSPTEVRYIPINSWEYEYATSWLYMNWGWNERGNGWFNPHSAAVTIEGEYRDYKYNRGMVTNIYPNR